VEIWDGKVELSVLHEALGEKDDRLYGFELGEEEPALAHETHRANMSLGHGGLLPNRPA
jgi:hypothetical protein